MNKVEKFDVVVIGAGPGGYVAAIRAAQLGLKVAIVEKNQLGGICLNWGCIPTKALLSSASVLRSLRHAKEYGISVQGISVDLSNVVERSRKVAKQLQNGVQHLMKKNNVTVFQGAAYIQGEGSIVITQDTRKQTLYARHIVVATGASARVLDTFPMGKEGVWYYKDALMPESLPKKLLVIGAGAIGVEFACFYHDMGVDVTLIEAGSSILPAEDGEVSAYMQNVLSKDGIHLHVGTMVKRAEYQEGKWNITLDNNEESVIQVDKVLVAIGVVGNIQQIGLENTKVEVKHSFICTDDFGATAEKGIYAIGDVAGAPCLAHKAYHQAVKCIEKIAGKTPKALDFGRIPACTYSYPQVAHIGMTEEVVKQKGIPYRIGKFPFSANGKAIAAGATEGFVKVIFERNTGELLGAHMVGHDVTEMLQGYGIAMSLETTEQELMETIFAHPTQSEAMHEAVLAAFGQALHT